MKTILAIDPGLSGGVAVSRFGKAECWPMPETEGDLLELVREIRDAAVAEGGELVCVLEEVSGFAGKAQPGSAMFRFGEHFGFIKGVIQALEMRLVLVRPQVWQKGFRSGHGFGVRVEDELEEQAQGRGTTAISPSQRDAQDGGRVAHPRTLNFGRGRVARGQQQKTKATTRNTTR